MYGRYFFVALFIIVSRYTFSDESKIMDSFRNIRTNKLYAPRISKNPVFIVENFKTMKLIIKFLISRTRCFAVSLKIF